MLAAPAAAADPMSRVHKPHGHRRLDLLVAHPSRNRIADRLRQNTLLAVSKYSSGSGAQVMLGTFKSLPRSRMSLRVVCDREEL